ncbi:helix-turn-helix transcriptional regulator [Thermoleptolyngbya sp. C42_A2020_037]|uniref:helix-turn-helix domain-containing protein n=1 Tax=Thermoleptolyngbya sp. C42_A2020_037 TaxID=2747799 RepID=UPI0019EAE8F9|nr:helix-turn-helix transcriptional regulator [Thermoleptolyngbya sp. C42_A2020_037]MBF2083164.1 helix-turn-helix transcriptional regulator [Thermoleptolyngbya sp. C42_A2020_037]
MPKKPSPPSPTEISPLKQLREELGMSQEEFARALGISGQTVSRWELRKNVPTFTVQQMKALERLLQTIGKTILDLPDQL